MVALKSVIFLAAIMSSQSIERFLILLVMWTNLVSHNIARSNLSLPFVSVANFS
jgi:hypothetical protein